MWILWVVIGDAKYYYYYNNEYSFCSKIQDITSWGRSNVVLGELGSPTPEEYEG